MYLILIISRVCQQNAELKTFAIKISLVTTRHVVPTLNPGSDFRDSFCPVFRDILYIYMCVCVYINIHLYICMCVCVCV